MNTRITKGLLVLIGLFIAIPVYTQIVKKMDQYGPLNSYSEAYSFTRDISGNMIAGGKYFQSLAFGSQSVSSAGFDLFVAKFNNTGSPLWVRNAVHVDTSVMHSVSADHICTDASGNIYIAGTYKSSVRFDTIVLMNNGDMDIFYAKYNAAGVLQWARNIAAPLDQRADGLVCDPSGNIYLAGIFKGTVLLGSSTYVSSANDDFISKVDPATGNILQSYQIGCRFNNSITSMVSDKSGNIYVAGHFSDTITFGSTVVSAAGNMDIFLAKYNSTGLAWAKNFGGRNADDAMDMFAGDQGHIFLVGTCSDTSSFDTVTLRGSGNYIMRFDTSGGVAWVRSLGKGYITPTCVATDVHEYIYVAGYYNNYAIFNSQQLNTSNGGSNAFFATLSNWGGVSWVKSSSSTVPYNLISTTGIAAAPHTMYVAGWFNYSNTLDTISFVTGSSVNDYRRLFIGELDDITLGTREISVDKEDITIFPNPSSGEFRVTLSRQVMTGSQIAVINTLGQNVLEKQITEEDIQQGYLNMTTRLPQGIFYIVIPGTATSPVKMLIAE